MLPPRPNHTLRESFSHAQRTWRPFACYRGKAREIKGRRDSWLSGKVCFYKDGGGISYFPGIGG
jgi:hypothetical protein